MALQRKREREREKCFMLSSKYCLSGRVADSKLLVPFAHSTSNKAHPFRLQIGTTNPGSGNKRKPNGCASWQHPCFRGVNRRTRTAMALHPHPWELELPGTPGSDQSVHCYSWASKGISQGIGSWDALGWLELDKCSAQSSSSSGSFDVG